MRAAIYCRVSTEDQEREGTSLDSQREACLAKAKELGYEMPEDFIFIETYSGLTLERPQLTTLRNKVIDGKIEAVIVYTPDRLCRVGEDILALAKEFKVQGVRLVFVKEQWEDTLNGKLIAFVLGWASEFEAAQIKERTMRGKRSLLNRGILPQGTGKGLYGYKWDKEQKKRIPFESEAKVVKKIFTMIADGACYFNAAKQLNEQGIPTKSGGRWHPLTIKRIANNPAYIGLTYFGKTKRGVKNRVQPQPEDEWVILPEVTPAIISRELFDQAQQALQRPKSRPGRALHDYVLTGHIICGNCGSPLVGSCLNKRYRYYYCTGGRATASRERICPARYVKADPLEELVWNKVREVLENPKVILAELQRQVKDKQHQTDENLSLDKEIAKLRRGISKYDYQEKRLVSLFRHEEIAEDYILDEMSKLKKEREVDQERLSNLEQLKQRQYELQKAEIRLEKFCATVRQNLDQCTIYDKRLALDALDIKVVTTPDRVEVQGVIPIDLVTIEQTSA